MYSDIGEQDRIIAMRKSADDIKAYKIGSNIRSARKRADLTQEQLSESIGVTPQYLSDLERGLVGTSVATLMRICTRLNISADYILFGGDESCSTAGTTLIERIQRLPKHKVDLVERTVDVLFEAMDMDPGQKEL